MCKTIAEFALEYRTTREKVTQQREKKASNRERKKTRGKMIVDVRVGANICPDLNLIFLFMDCGVE